MAGDLQDLVRQLTDVRKELAEMPRHKEGSQWHADRISEEGWLVRTIARMEKQAK